VCEALIGSLSALAGTGLGGFITYRIMLKQQRFELGRELRAIAREKKEAAIASAERVTLCLKRVQRIHFTRQQSSGEAVNDSQVLADELNLMQVQARAEMEEALLNLRTLCGAYFSEEKFISLLTTLEETARYAYASASSQESLEPVEECVRNLNAALRVQADAYKG